MFRFANPEFLYLCLSCRIIVFYIYSVVARKKAIKKYGIRNCLSELMPEVSEKRQT